ncbi:MAG: hypothetical protein R3D34_17540 [Nitratireductor sp.]
MSRVNLSQQIACVSREIAMRQQVYPGQVSRGKMRGAEAEYEIACMEQVLKTLRFVQQHHAEIVAVVAAKGEKA